MVELSDDDFERMVGEVFDAPVCCEIALCGATAASGIREPRTPEN
ncbi:hypothetical protein [Agromyces sp. Marseille-P2726]|nr:hypothetical protein [Agromyces sp. Marseille-P2726]